MKANSASRLLVIMAAVLCTLTAAANVNLPSIFSDHMVLQRNTEVPIWGFSKSSETITVQPGWTEESYSMTPGPQGTWTIMVPTPEAGGPYDITISGYSTVVLKDVLIGEVWLVSGQSNMEWSASSGIPNAEQEIAGADYPEIRLFQVGNAAATSPQQLLFGNWEVCTPESMKTFSAAGYFFGRKLHQELDIPIGVINSSWGGTPAEAWTPAGRIETYPMLREIADRMEVVPWGPVETARLWNGMIAPLVPFRMAGVLWYQGEANVGHAGTYDDLLAEMVDGWRKAWGYDFPFYLAQIAPWTYGGNDQGVALRDAQRRALHLIPNSGMIMTSDITDDVTDIHPRNKQDVGKRFADMALKYVYGAFDGEATGPLVNHVGIHDGTVRIEFSHADGLHSREDPLPGFELAGPDRVFHPATAEIDGNSVMVSSPDVAHPVAVRYAWEDTAFPQLFNSAGLPASSFRTDDWPLP